MLMREFLRLFLILGLYRFHDMFMFFIRGFSTGNSRKCLLSYSHHILMKIFQKVFKHLGITCFIKYIMKSVVKFSHLIHMIFLSMKICKIDIFFHLFHLTVCDMFTSPSCGKTFKERSYHIYIMNILSRDARHISTLIWHDPDKTFQL